MGRKYIHGECGRKFKDVLERLGVLLGGFDVGEFVPWLVWVKYVNGMNSKVRSVAEDLDEFGNSGFGLDEISIKPLILDMFAAGTDTTYTLIEWTLSELIRHKNIMSKLKHELKNIAGPTSTITEDNLHKCHYLKAVVKETLRLHPPPLLLLVP
ncbi:PREDICTED: cytochrome P450 71A3-like [Erythranthe guttata]|uniref:cytochrome P450 71A3-like n=1 Tax=Erythranthe guttata TaxID=4155 RepID=UPI00064DE9EE|nr:PREDICTED: cytochrome P450 71A3-like [Erythranthe guttata]|eukprot:XP_012835532.1 PREDICTED: cytochrome P450 71A3-like [Erythranthe guttata]